MSRRGSGIAVGLLLLGAGVWWLRPSPSGTSGVAQGTLPVARGRTASAAPAAVEGTPAVARGAYVAEGALRVEVRAGGRPVRGARVVAWQREARDPSTGERAWRRAGEAVTDVRGEALLACGAGEYVVSARASGLAPAREEVVRPAGEDETRVRLALEQGAALTGRVVVRGAGEPVPLAEVTLAFVPARGSLRTSGELPEEEREVTDADGTGRFHVEGLAPGTYRVEASAPGHARAVRRDVWAPGSVTLELERAALLEGFVLDADGRPAPNAQVLVGGRRAAEAVTGAGGGWALEVEPGAHTVLARRGSEVAALERAVVVGPGGVVRDVNLRLGAGGRFEGRVTARASGQPVAGAEVLLSPHGANADLGRARTDADGAFTLERVPEGAHDVAVRADGFSPAYRRGLVLGRGERFVLTLELEATGTVVGSVSTSGRAPVPGVEVRLAGQWGSEAPAALAARTDAQGTFRLEGVPAGSWAVVARNDGDDCGLVEPVRVEPGREVRADLVLDASGVVEGRVTTARGEAPPEGTRVQVWPENPSKTDGSSVPVGAAGRYRLSVPAGVYKLRAAFGRTAGFTAMKPVRVEPGRTLTHDLVLDAEPERVVRVRVLEPEGAPSANATVSLRSEGMSVMLVADEDGRATLTPRDATDVMRLTAWNGARTGWTDVRADGRDEVVVALRPGASLTGRVVDADGKAVEGFTLQAWAQDGLVRSQPLSREFPGASFSLPEVPAGALQLRVETRDGRTGTTSVDTEPGRPARVDVRVEPAASVSLRVVNPGSRAPLAGVMAALMSEQRVVGGVQTDSEGRAVLGHVPPGRFQLALYYPKRGRVLREVRLAAGERLELGDIEFAQGATPPGMLGLDLAERDGQLVISGVADEGPAAQAGLLVGEVLAAVEGAAVRSLRELGNRLAGPPGSEVRLTVRRGERERTVTLVRAR